MGKWEINWTSERSIWVRAREDRLGVLMAGRLADSIVAQRAPRVRAALPSAGGVLVEFDLRQEPVEDPWALLASLLESFDREEESGREQSAEQGREIMIPVCYDPSVGADLEAVCSRLGLDTDRLIDLHGEETYRVVSMGFLPGFGYLEGLGEALRLPRRETPRTRVPAGSVAIAEDMTGVYPHESAGGWHLIGRTPMRLFDPGRAEPSLLRVGDRVRFERIEVDAYHDAMGGKA